MGRIECNAFESLTVSGQPRTVISRGKVTYEDGEVKAKAGDGDFIARKAYAPVDQSNAIWRGVTQPKRINVVP